MPFIERFCCCFDLRTGAIFAGFYVLAVSCVFLVKNAVWVRLVSVGQVHGLMWPFVMSIMRVDNNTSYYEPITLNFTATPTLYRRYVASHVLHLLWTSGGIVTSSLLLLAIFKKSPILFLPWLSWSSVNCIILLVNSVVDIIIWVHFRMYNSLNAFTVFGYANVPFLLYLLIITATYYQRVESMYEEHELPSCWACCTGTSFWRRVSTSENLLGEPNSQRPSSLSNVRQYSSTVDEERTACFTSDQSNSTKAFETKSNSHAVLDGSEKKSSLSPLIETVSSWKTAQRKPKRLPKIRVTHPSAEDDW